MRKINGEFWLCIGSQDLYGDAVLENVKKNGEAMVAELNASGKLDYKIVLKPVLITSSLIKKTFEDANRDENCLGVITWMHTFSPSKSWIPGLKLLTKPLLHFHTQFRKEIPYDTIDMDYMNENQSAHGDREYAFALSRLRMPRGIVIGHYQDERVQGEINSWMKAAAGIVESSRLRILRIADNMRNVAVTEGDKVEAAYKLGWEVDTYPVNDIVKYVDAVSEAEVNA
ncbi:MAG: L-arabinose isomerase, partial [Parasporobacterium sp.]|nr:L-arabinose isomerase [Parasporobacterium sp.]